MKLMHRATTLAIAASLPFLLAACSGGSSPTSSSDESALDNRSEAAAKAGDTDPAAGAALMARGVINAHDSDNDGDGSDHNDSRA